MQLRLSPVSIAQREAREYARLLADARQVVQQSRSLRRRCVRAIAQLERSLMRAEGVQGLADDPAILPQPPTRLAA